MARPKMAKTWMREGVKERDLMKVYIGQQMQCVAALESPGDMDAREFSQLQATLLKINQEIGRIEGARSAKTEDEADAIAVEEAFRQHFGD